MKNVSISFEQRQVIFRAVIEAQDAGATVAESRNTVAQTYEITMEQLKEIEREGIEGQWPPL